MGGLGWWWGELSQRTSDIPIPGWKLIQVASCSVGGADFVANRCVSAGAALGYKLCNVVAGKGFGGGGVHGVFHLGSLRVGRCCLALQLASDARTKTQSAFDFKKNLNHSANILHNLTTPTLYTLLFQRIT